MTLSTSSRTPERSGGMYVARHLRVRDAHGQALLEMAVALPLLLLVSVSIFEFGRAYQTW